MGQFAYVASHDLQEPLRKVTSFCQLLQRRYRGQLDEKADQYIDFAVDGAKRMQVLINDLLAFSRVGRVPGEAAPVSCETALKAARANLELQIKGTGAVIEADPLPVVAAQLPLLTAVFQNLIGNAIKFRGERPPRVTICRTRRRAAAAEPGARDQQPPKARDQQPPGGPGMPVPSAGSSTSPYPPSRRTAPKWITYQSPRQEMSEAIPNERSWLPCRYTTLAPGTCQ